MKPSLCALIVLVSNAENVTPVQKVVQMMQGMLDKGKKEKQEEQIQFATFKQFCDGTVSEKERSVSEAQERIEILKADIAKAAADASTLTTEITQAEDDIAVWQGDKRAATKVREIENADYDAMHEDYNGSIDALERAIQVLKKQVHDRKQASLTQVASLQKLNLIPIEAKVAINVFLQQSIADEGLEVVAAPEANAYEFQSSKIVDMLKKLLDKFMEERTVLEEEETNSKHAYQMLMQDLESELSTASKDKTTKAELKSKKLQTKADATGDLMDVSSTMQDDDKYMRDLIATCETKAMDFEKRQELRQEELEAIAKAMEIVGSEAVQGSANKHLPGLAQTSFAQLRSSDLNPLQRRASRFLQDRARRLHSKVLAVLTTHVASDPFAKIKKMIKDLIVKLMEEANEEVEHKGWCDTELSTNAQTRQEKTEFVELLHAEIDQLEASITQLSEDLRDLTKSVAELDKAMAEATGIRNQEKAKNSATTQDAEAAQVAVAQALTVLREFYAKAAEATALIQQQPEAPEIFDKPYKGMGAESGGIVGMLEVIEKDFGRLSADTESAEVSASEEYDEFMTDSRVDKAQKSSSIEHKSAKKQDESQTLTTKKSDLEGTQKELDAALAYFDKLKPSCVDSGVSFEDRVARRKDEIESLQEADRKSVV